MKIIGKFPEHNTPDLLVSHNAKSIKDHSLQLGSSS